MLPLHINSAIGLPKVSQTFNVFLA